MKWYYFILKGTNFKLAREEYFGERPTDSLDDEGNPHTPYYRTEDHWDKDHIHIYAKNLSDAKNKCKKILKEIL
jgi:hypothetical protein